MSGLDGGTILQDCWGTRLKLYLNSILFAILVPSCFIQTICLPRMFKWVSYPTFQKLS